MRFQLIEGDLLNEDRTVKFDGVTFPNYGWCVIMCGGPGIGKSTAYRNLVSINAKKFDVDDLKTYKLETSELEGNKLIMKNGDVWELDGIPEPYNMSNPAFTSFVHEKTRPFARKVKQQFFNMGVKDNKETLPNIVFDITGSDIEDFQYIIENVKPLGYKISVVWVLGDFEQAIKQNAQRGRQVDASIVFKKHKKVMSTVQDLLLDKVMLRSIDEFWVIVQSVFNPNDPDDLLRYQSLTNVYRLKGRDDLVDMPEIVAAQIAEQTDKLQAFEDEMKKKNKQ